MDVIIKPLSVFFLDYYMIECFDLILLKNVLFEVSFCQETVNH